MIAGAAVTVVVTVSVAVTGAPVGGVPATSAVLTTDPASTSAWVSVYEAVQVVFSPGASVVTGQVTVPTVASSMAIACRVTLPVLVTRKL